MKSNLIELVKENPGLPIFALVDSDVVADDGYQYWYGELGNAEIKEYAKVGEWGYEDKSTVLDDELDDYEEWLIEGMLEDKEIKVTEEQAEEEAKGVIELLKWNKAIFVYINTTSKL